MMLTDPELPKQTNVPAGVPMENLKKLKLIKSSTDCSIKTWAADINTKEILMSVGSQAFLCCEEMLSPAAPHLWQTSSHSCIPC